jgi:hypothetical protein
MVPSTNPAQLDDMAHRATAKTSVRLEPLKNHDVEIGVKSGRRAKRPHVRGSAQRQEVVTAAVAYGAHSGCTGASGADQSPGGSATSPSQAEARDDDYAQRAFGSAKRTKVPMTWWNERASSGSRGPTQPSASAVSKQASTSRAEPSAE